jgi:hypothetical protein
MMFRASMHEPQLLPRLLEVPDLPAEVHVAARSSLDRV